MSRSHQSSFTSLRALSVVFGLSLLSTTPAWASDPLAVAVNCLEHFDLGCAVEARVDVPAGTAQRALDARIAFHQGRYDVALKHMQALESDGVNLEAEDGFTPYKATAAAAAGMVEFPGEGVRVRVAPGVDYILTDDAIEVLGASRRTYDTLFGGGPNHDIVLDIFPSNGRFIDASGLPPEAVRKTSVIALSKWTRLLLTSPRSMARGYGWKDTTAHEYIHLVVAYRSENRAPVWLQEGLAKHLESRWRGDEGGGLGATHKSLLAKAVRDDAFVPFEKFARSMAYLSSGEEAALAFAQVATMVQFFLERAGEERLPDLMDRLRSGEDAMATFSDLAGYDDFHTFRAAWKEWLRTLPLVERRLASLPVVLDGEGDDYATDPLLSGRPDLARLARVGDLLRERGRCDAALVEYAKAADPAEPPSPLLLAREATCHEVLGDLHKALALVDEGVSLYPEFTLLQTTRGRLLESTGRPREAVAAWQAAHDLNPYNPDVQDALVRGYEAIGDAERARRHLRYARILATGGSLDDG
jgi:tetratricopeptide (TPR) repeat protein